MAIVFGCNPIHFHIIQHTLRSMTPHSFFYTDINGQKQGPFNTQQLQTLAARGAIMPNTPLEREDGRQGFAHQISGLNFNVPIPVPPPVSTFAQPPVTPTMQASESDAMGMEMLLLIILSIVLGGLCVMKLVGLPWIVFVPMSIITIAALMFFWDRKEGNELKDRANRGDAQAMYDLALRHQRRNQPNEATLYLKQAAENGFAQAQLALGLQYKDGDGIENNPIQAAFWFEKAAEQGIADAQYELGLYYRAGNGAKKDLISAIFWFRKAAAQDHAEAREECLSLIHDAAKEGTIEDVRYFVEREAADVNAKDQNGGTPLLYAAGWNSSLEVMQYLVSKGANVNARNVVGNTPLIFAARSNSLETVTYLISQGAKINVKNFEDWTPLHNASDYNPDIEVLKFLISKGADVDARNSEGKTPLDIANLHYRIVNNGKIPKNVADTEEKIRILRGAGGKSGTSMSSGTSSRETFRSASSGEKSTKIKSNELCSSCRNLRTPNGHRLEDVIDAMHTNEKLKSMGDREANAAILSVLHNYPDQHCTTCYGLVLSRAR